MAVPEVPSQMVAQLVLGYLAEEQLMTAYDEFLHSSPYLDALQNEYDYILMTSLKHIVAEYRALRIHIEMCQPVTLRRRLLQFQNLLDMFKFLINNVDLQKIGPDKPNSSLSTQSIHHSHREKELEQFRIKKELSMGCHKDTLGSSLPCLDQSGKHQNNLVEATSLADLPGNDKTKRKKQTRVLDKNTTAVSPFNIASERDAMQSTQSADLNRSHLEGSVQNACSLSFKPHSALEPRGAGRRSPAAAAAAAADNNPERHSGTFQDFASGVAGGMQVNVDVPDSSTTENHNSIPKSVETNSAQHTPTYPNQMKGKKTQYLIHVSGLSGPNDRRLEDSQIKIISDVKVDGDPTSRLLNPGLAQNATSTPAPRGDQLLVKRSYTKDEIMAMPTIILVPTGPPPPSVVAQPIKIQPMVPPAANLSVSSAGTAASLEPLTIDIADSPVKPRPPAGPPAAPPVPPVSPVPPVPPTTAQPHPAPIPTAGAGLVTTAELRNASVPKDSVVSIVGKTSTPQVLPLQRKSSSTPRRTSHVRVLDFATPRRILHGTIGEHVPPNEVILSRSPNMMINEAKASSEDDTKENKLQQQSNNKQNWDAELRALVGNVTHSEKTPKPKPRPRSTKKKNPPEKSTKKLSLKGNAKKKQKSPNNSQESIIEVVVEPEVIPEVAVKPTINIITEWNPSPAKDDKSNDKSTEISENKSSSDTPDMDRLSLQNAIGAKLNISDLLETPYKQALYDIQMETPRFLRPDIPGSEPVSEIKITDIPTPRFFNTPGVSQATPGSYCSRPTDYSSGGSYYKPDDHDYAPLADLDCVITGTEPVPDPPKEKDLSNEGKSTRPVRKCTKNISYCAVNSKTAENKPDLNSSTDASLDVTGETNKNSCTTKDEKSKTKESKRKSTSVKNRRSSRKETPNKFMKIKPRRPTPVKLNRSKTKKETVNSPMRKRTSSKEKSAATAPVVIPAPTKSRRKSSTPRKLHTKIFSSESLDTNSSESINRGKEMNKFTASNVHDSDTENLPLRWSDDCSRGSAEPVAQSKDSPANSSATEAEDINKIKAFIESTVSKASQKTRVTEPSIQKKVTPASSSANEIEDINSIKAYIESTVNNASQTPVAIEEGSSFHIDLVERGFDIETAKSIERDLLDPCPVDKPSNKISFPVHVLDKTVPNKSVKNLPSNASATVPDQSVKNIADVKRAESEINNQSDDEEEVEFSIHECNDETNNFFVCEHDAQKKSSKNEPVKIKDTFSMEICLEDDVIRLKATPFISLLDEEPGSYFESPSFIETEAAVSSIASMDRLYTPIKDQRASIQAQCIEMFDSTLTSLDTPLKVNSPKPKDVSIRELVEVTVEKEAVKDKGPKKRKRTQSSPDTASDNKKNKKETRYLPNIQNFDIDTVLSKLHGP